MEICSIGELAERTGWGKKTIYAYASLERDPLPIWFARGKERNAIVFMDEFRDWVHRTGTMHNERRKDAEEAAEKE